MRAMRYCMVALGCSAMGGALPVNLQCRPSPSTSSHRRAAPTGSTKAGSPAGSYLISSDLVDHPLFKILIERSGGGASNFVGCEVVLFEHLLWVLENAEPHPELLDELVKFYAC